MLLRRIIEHVRAQNWTAVALDFAIVVVGVFIGIQVSNWNDARHNETRKDYAMNALQTEFEQNIETLQSALRYLRTRSEIERDMVKALATGHSHIQEEETIQEAFTQIMYFSHLGVRDSAYESLKQSGDLSLIEDQKVLMALNDYSRLLNWTQEQRSNFRVGISGLGENWRDYVFHSPTDDPSVTAVEVEIGGLASDRRAFSAVAEVVRMKSIFSSYIPRLIVSAVTVCEMLATETQRPCKTPDNLEL